MINMIKYKYDSLNIIMIVWSSSLTYVIICRRLSQLLVTNWLLSNDTKGSRFGFEM